MNLWASFLEKGCGLVEPEASKCLENSSSCSRAPRAHSRRRRPRFSIPISEAEIEGTRYRDRAETGFHRSDQFEIGTRKIH